MNRRDFLSLRMGRHGHTLELSCERLYMRCLDARVGVAAPDSHDEGTGEPPAVLDRRTPEALFQEIDRDLAGADSLLIVDRQWLADHELNRQLDAVVAAFRARGGRVDFSPRRTGS